jgi:Bacterial Ig-like domain (group 3)
VLSNYNINYGTANFTITAASTTTTISSVNPSPATVGQPATVTVAIAPIAPGAGTPTGTVTVSSPGAPTSCTVTLPANSCMLTLTSLGSQSITATYNGDSNFKSSPSSAFPVTVKSSLILQPAVLAGGDQGVLYQPQQLVATGGMPPYGNWSWTPAANSAVPPGLSLDPSAGTITGTPTAAGTYTFIVSVMDSSAAVASQTYSITVNLPPAISGATLPPATVGTTYTSAAIPVTNGTSPFNWSATGLPAGLSISGGVISGTATGGSFAPPYDAPSWTASASNGGTTTITPNCLANVSVTDAVGGAGSANFQIGSTPSSPCAAFSYNLVEDGGGVPESTWSFSDTAATTGTLTFNWQYVGFHAFFDVTALLQVFSGSNTVTLYSASAATCCSSPSGGFNVQGTASIAVTAGQPFGFTVGGSNFDSNATLNGTLYITDFTPPAPPPHP